MWGQAAPPRPAPCGQVEEGLCQLAALLYLEGQQEGGYKNAYEERLAAFLGHQIRLAPPWLATHPACIPPSFLPSYH